MEKGLLKPNETTIEWKNVGLRVQNWEEVGEKFYNYIMETDIPILKEFTSQQGLSYDSFMRTPELIDLVKLALDKKEAVLEKKGLLHEINAKIAQSSLIQLGWRTKPIEQIREESVGSDALVDLLDTLKEAGLEVKGLEDFKSLPEVEGYDD
jgi:hypothetical protein